MESHPHVVRRDAESVRGLLGGETFDLADAEDRPQRIGQGLDGFAENGVELAVFELFFRTGGEVRRGRGLAAGRRDQREGVAATTTEENFKS